MLYGMKMQATVISMVMATALPALAGDWGFAFNFSKDRYGHHGIGVGVAVGRPAVIAPAPVVVAPAPVVAVPVVPARPVYIPPVYSMVSERVWVPTVQTLFRDVPVMDACGRVISYRREPYTVSNGYWTVVQRRVMVREGYWTTAVAGAVVPPAQAVPMQPGPGFNGDYDNAGYEPQPWTNGNGPRSINGAVRAAAIQDRSATY